MNEELDTTGAVAAYLKNGTQPDPAQGARVSLNAAVGSNPDYEAELRKAARKTGVPIDAARSYPDEVKRQAQINSIDFNTLSQQFPRTAAFLSGVDNARVAHDDVDNLSAMEKAVSAVKYLVSAPDAKNTLMGDIGAGVYQASRGAAGVFQAATELPAPLLDWMEATTPEQFAGWRGAIGGNPLRRLSEGFAAQGKGADQEAKRLSPAQIGTFANGVSSGVQSLTQNLLTLPMALFPGGQGAVLTSMAGMSGGQSYQQAREKGLPMQQALPFAASQAVIEYATEKIPVSRLIGDLTKNASLKTILTRQLAAELPGEQVATVLQDLNDWAVLNPEKPFSDYLAERPSAAAQTLIATAVGVGGNVAVMRAIENATSGLESRAQQSERNTQTIEQINQLAKASKLAQRDPDTFEAFVAQAAENGPVQDVYVNAQTLAQSGFAEQLAQVSPAVAEQLTTALATGGDIKIPVAEYAARIAPTEFAQGLLDHLKTEPQGMSRAEAQEFMQTQQETLQAEIEKAIATKQGDDTFKASADEVKNYVKAQLQQAGRFTDTVHDAYATLWAARFATLGAQLNRMPMDLLNERLLTVQTEGADGPGVLGQGNQFDVSGLTAPEQIALIQGEAEKLAGSLREQGFDVTVEHSGSAAGPSSYLRVYDPSTGRFFKNQVRLSGHSKGAFNSAQVWDVATPQDFEAVVKAAQDMRAMGVSPGMAAILAKDEERLLKSADKKLAKGKSLTKSEQEAVDRRTSKPLNQSPAFDGPGVLGQGGREPIPFDKLVLAWHTSPKEVTSIDKNGSFGDVLFFSPNQPYRMSAGETKLYAMELNEDKIIDDYDLEDQASVEKIAERLDVDEETALDLLQGRETVSGLSSRGLRDYDGEDDWVVQRVQGEAARAEGYDAARSKDEQGAVLIVPMSDKLNRLYAVGDKDWREYEQEVYDRYRSGNPLNQSPAFDGPETGNTPIGDMTEIEVDGKMRPALNSNGKPIHPTQEGVRNFWKWFGDSKVVDDQGRPQVVYHGTGAASNFSEFGGARAFYFSKSPGVANSYAKQSAKDNYILWRDSAERVLPVYLAISNPLIIDAGSKKYDPNIVEGNLDKARYEKDIVGNRYGGMIVENIIDDYQQRGKPSDIYVALNPTQIKSATGNSGAFDAGNANILMQSAYHGSPHRFDKFSLDAMGTGEGAQAYGWGLYFASKKEIANWYTGNEFGGATVPTFYEINGQRTAAGTPEQKAADLIFSSGVKGARNLAKSMLADAKAGEDWTKAKGLDYYQRVYDLTVSLQKSDVKKAKGQLYKVEIPDDDTLLLWDKPLSEQPAKVLTALKGIDSDYFRAISEVADGARPRDVALKYGMNAMDIRGADGAGLYQQLSREKGGDKVASEYLKSLGISGIKYLDGSSRGAGDGSYNYVVFSADDVAIQEQFYQRQAQGNRGSYNPTTNVITLLKNADLSTFLHESGHFFLETQVEIAAQLQGKESLTVGEKQLLQDTNALLKWFGVPDLATWYNLDFEEKRSYHEQFARGFEAYLFEGKAPNIELQGVFQRFRAWLLNVYRDLKNLNVELTDEVRGVFDRMLATTDEIKLAEQGRSMMPLFASAEQAGMTPEEFAAYQSLGTDASNDAIQDLQARTLRDMQWLNNARGREIKRLQKQSEGLRREVRMEVQREVMSQPIYRAWQFLTAKEEPNGKLSRNALAEMYGGNADGKFDKYALLDWKRLTNLRMTAEEGLHPDVVAEMFGLSSGDELVRTLTTAQLPKDEIEGLTDARMLEQYGELSSPEAIEREADRAIHNEARARFVATEVNALAKVTGKPKILASAARELARTMIARLKVRDIRPGQYANAEARAAKAAEKASKSGDLETAGAEKRNQLVNTYLAREAYGAQDEIEKGLRYLNKFDGDVKGLDADYADQIDALRERFDFRKGQSLKAIDKRKSLAEWIESQREQGLEPDVPPELVNEAFRKSYKDMTVEEFRGLVDTIKQIEHLGRLKKKLLTAADNRAFDAVRTEIVQSIEANAGDREADTRTPTTNLGRALQQVKRFYSAHIKAATWARILDGGKDGGPMWEYFIRSANERGDMETTMRAEATVRLSEIMAPVFKLGKMGGKGQFFPTINRSLNREARITLALNIGNAGNLQRLLGGEGWTAEQIIPVLQTLTAEEKAAVQAVWDHFESYRPQIAAKEQRVYGKEPDWVEPGTALTEALGLRGGYYPIKYDPQASQRAEEHADAEGAKRQLQGAYTTATTRRSFTKSRTEEVVGRPLLYTLAGLYSGVNDVIHDLTWHEWLIDANRLLRSKSIDTAIRTHYGPEVKAQFKTWAADIAEGDKAADNAGEVALSRLRQGISAAGLGFNAMSAAMQVLGFSQSIVRVGPTWVGKGIARYVGSPLSTAREVNEKSAFMANRSRTRFRELNELRNQVQDESDTMRHIKAGTYFLMMRAQQMVDVPTWIGAYEKAIADGNAENRAIALADQSVIDAQGGGQTKDLSAIERGGPALKVFTVFYSFMNTAFNLGVGQTMTTKSKVKLMVDYLLLYSVPAVFGALLKDTLTPGGDDDDDLEALAKKLAAEQLSYLMGMMVIAREFAFVAKTVTGAEGAGRDYTGPAGLRLIGDVGSLAKQSAQGEFDDAFRKAAINVVGDLTGLPSAQANRTITGATALVEGETDNPAAVVFGFQRQR